MTTNEVIQAARGHIGTGTCGAISNALVALFDAQRLLATNEKTARRRALTSLAYSVGVNHPDYVRACRPNGVL